ncbi:MAG: hypothetical protein U5K28_07255 [Halobacteriales archaeon]|nr:hypothetical protein [Halobacteriales archaeon]
MSTVSIQECVSYGLSLAIYVTGFVLVSGVAFGIGGFLMARNAGLINTSLSALGFLFQLAGSVIFLTGGAGALYKIIADGVRTGSLELD